MHLKILIVYKEVCISMPLCLRDVSSHVSNQLRGVWVEEGRWLERIYLKKALDLAFWQGTAGRGDINWTAAWEKKGICKTQVVRKGTFLGRWFWKDKGVLYRVTITAGRQTLAAMDTAQLALLFCS